MSPIDTTLIGKPIETMTPAELGQLTSQLAAYSEELEKRRKAVQEQAQATEFKRIVDAAKVAATNLGWAKFPKLQLIPNETGNDYRVDYIVTRVRKAGGGNGGKRTTTGPEAGKLTINKMLLTLGELDHFEVGKDKFEAVKEVVKALKQPDGKSEADRCWEISKKGVSGSDIITKYHPTEVVIVLKTGVKMTVGDAVKKLSEARTEATSTAEVPV